MGINLDELFNDDSIVVENKSGITDLAVVQKSKATAKRVEDTSVATLTDRYQNLAYLIDKSGSMHEPYSPGEGDYNWPENLKEYIHAQMEFDLEARPDEAGPIWEAVQQMSDVELKIKILTEGPQNFGIYQQSASGVDRSKMGLVKSAVADLVDRRYEKFPDARVLLVPFNSYAQVTATSHERIKIELQQLWPEGGTNIYNAVTETLAYFKKYPSPVSVNHIVLVTDGEDWNAMQITELKEEMKTLGVVFDYIYITSKYATGTASSIAQTMKTLCEEFNGEYAEVKNPEEFKRKLLEYSTRLCLTAGD